MHVGYLLRATTSYLLRARTSYLLLLYFLLPTGYLLLATCYYYLLFSICYLVLATCHLPLPPRLLLLLTTYYYHRHDYYYYYYIPPHPKFRRMYVERHASEKPSRLELSAALGEISAQASAVRRLSCVISRK